MSPKTLFLKPAENPEEPGTLLKVPDPAMISARALMHLPPEGRRVESSLYWVKRIRDGEVIVCPDPAEEAPDVPRAIGTMIELPDA